MWSVSKADPELVRQLLCRGGGDQQLPHGGADRVGAQRDAGVGAVAGP
jgi:hypothetical protein